MKIKTYYAKTMAEALQEIKAELGPDALLLSSKEIPSRSGVGGSVSGFEVVAASDDNSDMDLVLLASRPETGKTSPTRVPLKRQAVGQPATAAHGPFTYSPATLLRSRDVASERRTKRGKLRAGRGALNHRSVSPLAEPIFPSATSAELYSSLIAIGIEEWLACKLLNEALQILTPRQSRSRVALLRSVSRVAQGLVQSFPSENRLPAKRVVVFLGPTGVGKTTSVAKLAAQLALLRKKKIVLMTLDGFRIGAIEQLRTFAGLIGIPFRFVSQISDLPQAIQEHAQRDYILLDTTGRGPKDLGAMRDLAEFLRMSDQMERHLVLSATTKSLDLYEIVDRFEICRPDHLLFTKLDETSTLGPILNALVRTRKSPSYYADGQRVPDDLHTASKEKIVDLVLHQN